MNLVPDRKLTTQLFNPFVYLAGGQALSLGLAAILLAGMVGYWGHTHFDGVLDSHMGRHAPLSVFLSEGFVDWFCMGSVLLVFGRIISHTSFRTIDLLGTQALARWPTLFIGLLALLPAFQRFGHALATKMTHSGAKAQWAGLDAIVFFAVVILMLPLVCWLVALMYKSYSVACNVTGAKAIGTFIAGLMVAEILSKIAIYWLLRLI